MQYLEVLQEMLTEVYAPDEGSIEEGVSQFEKLERTEANLKGMWNMSQEVVIIYYFDKHQLLTVYLGGIQDYRRRGFEKEIAKGSSL